LRENFATQAALAWALYRDRRFSEAVCWIEHALVSGAVTRWIYSAAGNKVEGRKLREWALNLNPAVAGFHVHH
jgi:hypothetical protein